MLVLLTFLLLAIAPAAPAHAQVRRCTSSAGNVVYTDRQCADIGASALVLPMSPSAGNTGSALRSMCARDVRDLAFGLESAFQSGDANRIAGLYDWTGMGTAVANRLMDHFARLASRTFVDVQPVYSDPGVAADTASSDQPAGSDGAAPTPRPTRRLIGLRVELVLSDGHTPAHETFGLSRRMGCWWIHS